VLRRGTTLGGRARRDRLVGDTRDDEPGREHRRHLRSDPEPADRDASRRSTAEERGERSGERDGSQVPERRTLAATAALEDRAVLALAQVGAQGPALGVGELSLLEP